MIKGKKVILRVSREDEIPEEVHLNNKFSDIGDFWPAWFMTESRLRKRFAEDGFWADESGKLIIADKSDKMVGNIMFFKSFQFVDGYEIAYRIFRPEDRGKGYMGEALKLFVSYMFEVKPINRFMLRIFSENIPSRKLAEKCGFKHEGTLREAMFHKGEFYDLEIYSIIRKDWESLKK
jgi:RimJ/RimL family protein N-acetyltransferase